MKTSTIKGFEKYTISENGEVINTKNGRKLTAWLCNTGYLRVSFGKHKKLLHRLIMDNLVENPNNYPYVNHLDGNKHNNNINNLEWCTHAHNIKHAIDMGLRPTTKKQIEAARQNGLNNKGIGKLILNIQTGIYYNSIGEAIESLSHKVAYTCLANKLRGTTKNNTPLIYV